MHQRVIDTSKHAVNKALAKLDHLLDMPVEDWDDKHVDMVKDLMKTIHCGCDVVARLSIQEKMEERVATPKDWLTASRS